MKSQSIFAVVIATMVNPLAALSIYAQVPDTLWTKTFGGALEDECRSVQQTADGGYILAGHTASFGAGGDDAYLVKTDANGDTLWTRTFGGANDNYFSEVQQTSDGGYILAGHTGTYPAWDVYLVKTDSSANQQWVYTYDGGYDDYGDAVDETDDGGYIVAGTTYGPGYRVLLIKVSANGSQQWVQIFDRPGIDSGWSVMQTNDGGYIIAGQTDTYLSAWLIKTDANGYEQWSKVFSGGAQGCGASVQQTSDGGYILAGYNQLGANSNDVWLIKTNWRGDEEWNRSYGGNGDDRGQSVKQTDDGGYIVAGITASFGAGSFDFWVLKTDANGNSLWSCPFGGSELDWGHSVDQTDDGGYVVGGLTNSFGAGGGDMYLVRLEAEEPPPDISVTLVPIVYPIQIPASGGSFEFYCFVTNNEAEAIAVDLWINAILPGGTSVGPLMGPCNVSIDPGTIGWYRIQTVPAMAPSGVYQYNARVGLYPGCVWAFDSFDFEKLGTSDGLWIGGWDNRGDSLGDEQVDAPSAIPEQFALNPPNPNPFNPTTTLTFSLPVRSFVKLGIFDVNGRSVEAVHQPTLQGQWFGPGLHHILFDGSDLVSGIYLARLEAGDYSMTRKLVLIK